MPFSKGHAMPHPAQDKLPDDKEFLSSLYWEKELSLDKIGVAYKVDRETVRRRFIHFGIPIRNYSQAQKLSGRSKIGAKNVNWNGGIKRSKGYVFIYKPEHPRAKRGYVGEHILVWEYANGKPLPMGWLVHHLNGIKSDNRPSNLVGLPNKKHYLILSAKAKRIQELEAILKNQGLLL